MQFAKKTKQQQKKSFVLWRCAAQRGQLKCVSLQKFSFIKGYAIFFCFNNYLLQFRSLLRFGSLHGVQNAVNIYSVPTKVCLALVCKSLPTSSPPL